ncbi:MAG: hypothetical protein IK045_05590 [Bacteroidales bacterium]|nr:hypothetical protein [Bacteroidales bacterium]
MAVCLKITLPKIKGFLRLYKAAGPTTLYTVHNRLRADLEFPQDQLILFKALGADEAVVARWGLFDIGDGAVEQISLSAALEKGVTHFVYFYDVSNRKSVLIDIYEDDSPAPKADKLVLSETKGPVPQEFENGYVALEDLPVEKQKLPSEDDFDLDDEDFDEEDDEDDDGEDGEEIYDENE